MRDRPPEFAELSKIEEALLIAKLQGTRKAITHAGEKGRTLEHEAISLFRRFLPEEYFIQGRTESTL